MVLTDYRLPNKQTAADVIRAVTLRFGAELAILIVTGEVSDLSDDAELEGRKVLRKPVEPARLIEAIRHAYSPESQS